MGQGLWQWFLASDNQELWLGVFVAFLLGLVLGSLSRSRQKNRTTSLTRAGDRAFFKGFQYILSNDPDRAIEEFTRSVQVNSDTIETYMVLGNLYRSKGDIERAIRIRENIILRPHIDEQIRLRALLDLGLDYRKGGFLNRALETFLEVVKKSPSHVLALEESEKIYEELKDWNNAYIARQTIARLTRGDHKNILAHHQTEMGKAYHGKGDTANAKACFRKAISIYEGCVDAYLHLGDLYFSQQDYRKAITTWKKVASIAPRLTFLAYRRLEGAYSRMKNLKPVEEFLKEVAQSNSDAFTHMALARYLYNKHDYSDALAELENALQLDPYFWEARRFLGEVLMEQNLKEKALSAYRDLISHLDVPYLEFQCTYCGFRPADLQWQCPQCRKWDTIDLKESKGVESTVPGHPQSQAPIIHRKSAKEDA